MAKKKKTAKKKYRKKASLRRNSNKNRTSKEVPIKVEKEETITTPTIEPAISKKEVPPIEQEKLLSNVFGPSIMPIPDAGMKHNIMRRQQNFLQESSKFQSKKKKNNSFIILIVVFAIVMIGIIMVYKNIDKSNKKNISSSSEKKLETLTCRLEEAGEEVGLESISVLTYLFEEDILIKTIDEESLIFQKEALEYYSIYQKSLEEWVESEQKKFDNVTLQIENTDTLLKVIYTVDLKEYSKNATNNLEELGDTYSQIKQDLEIEGYTCK